MPNIEGRAMAELADGLRPWVGALLPSEPAGVAVLAKFFRALGDSTRLRLLEFLMDREHTVSECVAHVGLAQGRVSAHLGCLADCGYVEVRRVGRYAYYRAAEPRVAEIVQLAHLLAADNAAAIASCVRIDTPAVAVP
jgi:ArsR family transcriptional regulator, cadmium/lead-responsive transcriptional repressor